MVKKIKKRMCDYTNEELLLIVRAHPEFKSPSFQLYVNDFLGSSRIVAMEPESVGTYFLLLLMEWNEPDCGLPKADTTLMKFARLYSEQWDKVKESILKMFFENSDRLYNRRLLEIRVEQILNREINRLNANKRWGKDADVMPNECDRMSNGMVSGMVIPVVEDEVVVEDKEVSSLEVASRYFESHYHQMLPPEYISTWRKYLDDQRESKINIHQHNVMSHLKAFKECFMNGINPPELLEAFQQSANKGIYWISKKLIERKNATFKQNTSCGKGSIDVEKYKRLAAKEPIV